MAFGYVIKMEARTASANRGIATIRRGLFNLESQVFRINRLLGSTLGLIGTGIAIRQTVNTLREFGQEMATVGAVSGATASEMAALTETALQLGETTRFTATQAAEGITQLARAGFTADQALQSIAGTLQLAQAGALDLGRATDIATNVMTAFGLTLKQAGDSTNFIEENLARVNDVLVATATRSNTTVDDLGTAFKFTAGTSRAFGISLEESSAALAVLANRGIKASIAGTGLSRLIIRLTSPTGALAKRFAQLGISTDQLTESLKVDGLAGTIRLLAEAGFTVRDFAKFGDRAGRIGRELVGSFADGDRSLEAFTAALANVDGLAEQVATQMDQNLNGAVLRMFSAIEGFVLRLGENGLTGALTSAAQGVAAAFNFMSDNVATITNVFQGFALFLTARFLPTIVLAAAGVGTIMVAAINRLLGFMPLLITGFTGSTVAVAGFGGAVSTTTAALAASPLGRLALIFNGIALAIGAATAAVIAFADQIPLASDRVATLQDVIDTFIVESTAGIEGLARTVTERLGGSFDEVRLQWDKDTKITVEGTLRAFARMFDNILILAARFSRLVSATFIALFEGVRVSVNSVINRLATLPNIIPGINIPELDVNVNTDKIRKAFEGVTAPLTGPIEGALDGLIRRADAQARSAGLSLIEDAKAARTAASAIETREPLGILPGSDADSAEVDKRRTTFEQLSRSIRDANTVLQANRREREALSTVLDFQSQLERRLTEDERAQVRQLVDTNRVLQLRADIIDDVRGPMEDLRAQQRQINALFAEGAITLDEYNRAIKGVEDSMENIRAQTDPIRAQLTAFANDATNLGEQLGNSLTSAFDRAGDALAKFVTGGKLNFGDLVNSMIADLAKLAIRSQVTGPLAAAISGFDFLGSLGLGTKASATAASSIPAGAAFAGSQFATGGLVGGVGTGTSDSNLARLSRGEFVVNAAATKRNATLLSTINSGGRINAGGGGDINFTVVDQRTVKSGEEGGVQTSQRRGPNGQREVQVFITDTVQSTMKQGRYDAALNNRFGVKPTTVQR